MKNQDAKQADKTPPKLPRCEWCGAEYLPASAWQKYCSDAHRQAAHQAKQARPK